MISRDSNGDQIAIAENAVRGVDVDPSTPRKVDLHPGMGSTAAAILITLWAVEITADKPRREPKCPKDSIISSAKSRQLPDLSSSVRTGSCVPGACLD